MVTTRKLALPLSSPPGSMPLLSVRDSSIGAPPTKRCAASYPGADLIPAARAARRWRPRSMHHQTDVWPWLVQMGTDRAGWYSWDHLDNWGHPSDTRIHPSGKRSRSATACRPCRTGASAGKSRRWSRSISWVCACRSTCAVARSTLRDAAPLLHRLALGLPAGGATGQSHAAGRQRVLGIPAALAAADHERALPGSAALDHANAAVREPEAPRRAHRSGHDDPDAVCRAGRRDAGMP